MKVFAISGALKCVCCMCQINPILACTPKNRYICAPLILDIGKDVNAAQLSKFNQSTWCLQVISFDVKPGNILLDKTMTIAKLSDMGLAKLLTRSQTMTMMVRPPVC